MTTKSGKSDTDWLVEQAREGDAEARKGLMERHRPRLRQMVSLRLDPRLAARVDPSDVVQEALAAAYPRLDDYLRDPPLPFYPVAATVRLGLPGATAPAARAGHGGGASRARRSGNRASRPSRFCGSRTG